MLSRIPFGDHHTIGEMVPCAGCKLCSCSEGPLFFALATCTMGENTEVKKTQPLLPSGKLSFFSLLFLRIFDARGF